MERCEVAMSEQPIYILINKDTPENILAQARVLSPRIVFVTSDDLRAHPERRAEITISYGGGIAPADWANMPCLRWVQLYGAGAERILSPEARAHAAVITNAHVHGEAIPEHLFAMLLALTRRLPEALACQRAHQWGKIAGVDVISGKTLGVMGVGAIGGRVAELARAFRLRVLGLRRSGAAAPGVARMYTPAEKMAFLAACDYVMAILPLTPETEHTLGAAEFAAMPPGALFFNVGRGKTVDTAALLAALRSGHLGGAGLDVTDPEPLPSDHPLWENPHVIITPHNAGLHPTYAQEVGALFLDNLRRLLAGEPLQSVVDKERGY
jgi:phosphoglycerate dehydrogenase-like enzyme